MKKILVIGINSYIGQKFKEYVIEMKNEDILIDLVSASDGSWKNVDFSRYNSIMLLSGIVHKEDNINMESIYYEVNYILAVQIAKKAKEQQVKQFIFMSTLAIFGQRTGCITKDTVPKPNTYYGKSKYKAEQDIMLLNDANFHVAIVRPPMVYGEGCKGNYQRLIKLSKITPIFPDYHNKRSILHINTLSEFMIQLIMRDYYGYFHPQNEEYGDTCKMVVDIRKGMGKKTILIKCFNPIIKYLIDHNELFNKVFGNLYYCSDN